MLHTLVMSNAITGWFTRKPGKASAGDTPRSPSNRRHHERHRASGAAKVVWLNSSGMRRSSTAEIQNVSAGGMAVKIPQPLEAGQMVILDWKVAEEKGLVRFCRQEADGFLAGVRFVPRDRRREDRLSVSGRGTLYWTDGPGERRAVAVTVTNVTDEGIQIEIPEAIPVSKHVRLSGDALECLGVLRYCEKIGTQFVGGIQLVRPVHEKNAAEYRN